MSYSADRARRSQAAIERHVAAHPDRWFGRPGRLVRLEGDDNPLARIMDLDAATDWWFLDDAGGIYPVATRAQFDGFWPSFTIRDNGESGEWTKLQRAWREGSLGPTYHVQLYVDDDGLRSGACARTRSVVERLLYNLEDPDGHARHKTNPTDGTPFWPVWWRWFRPADELRIVSNDPPPVSYLNRPDLVARMGGIEAARVFRVLDAISRRGRVMNWLLVLPVVIVLALYVFAWNINHAEDMPDDPPDPDWRRVW